MSRLMVGSLEEQYFSDVGNAMKVKETPWLCGVGGDNIKQCSASDIFWGNERGVWILG